MMIGIGTPSNKSKSERMVFSPGIELKKLKDSAAQLS
jgi:hypothetical protein